jgi:DNA-binding IclR family transcriptional regulator
LMDDIRSTRRNGFAIDREEHTLGICAVGVAMRDVLGNFVAISVPVPAQRFQAERAHICERLLATRRILQNQLPTT